MSYFKALCLSKIQFKFWYMKSTNFAQTESLVIFKKLKDDVILYLLYPFCSSKEQGREIREGGDCNFSRICSDTKFLLFASTLMSFQRDTPSSERHFLNDSASPKYSLGLQSIVVPRFDSLSAAVHEPIRNARSQALPQTPGMWLKGQVLSAVAEGESVRL